MTSIFGLLKGWWLFDDDVRADGPCVSQDAWKGLLHDAGFAGTSASPIARRLKSHSIR